MLKNKDLNAEIRAIIEAQHWSLTALADRMGTFDSNLHRLLKQSHVQENFIKLCDALGYDVEVKLTRKRGKPSKSDLVDSPAPPHGLETLSKAQLEDMASQIQTILETKK